MKKKGFVSFTILYVFLLSSIVLMMASNVVLDSINKKQIQHYQIEANSFIVSEQNNVINYCLGTPLINYVYYKNFNYGQRIKFILNCKTKVDTTSLKPYIEYDLKGCREKDYIKTGDYPVCLEYTGKIFLNM